MGARLGQECRIRSLPKRLELAAGDVWPEERKETEVGGRRAGENDEKEARRARERACRGRKVSGE